MFRATGRSFPRVALRPLRASVRRASFQYLHSPHFQPRQSKFKKFLYFNLGLVSATAFAYYMWWPKHTFPLSVAKILRKGLWAESDRGEYDYQLALKYYLEALQECDTLQMDRLCDEYTGIQLKVAEMYQRLDLMDDAAFVYNEIATLYLTVLKAPPNSVQGRRIRGIDHRAHLIQRDLRIALKLVELNRQNPSLSKAILITHLLIAQDEVRRKLGLPNQAGSLVNADELNLGQLDSKLVLGKASVGSKSGETATGGIAAISMGISPQTPENPMGDTETGDAIVLETNPEAWEPFADEFFNAMDTLAVICIAVGDITAACNIRISMTSKMLVAGVSPEKLLLSQCNTASLLYFQAEELQAREQDLRRKFADAAGIDYGRVKAIHDPLQPVEVSESEKNDILRRIGDVASPQDKRAYEQVVKNKEALLEMVVATYESVIAGLKQLPQEVAKDNLAIGETVALATYGLGVVNLHLSNYDKAERLLREARVRSKSCGYDALIDEIERELKKLFDERKMIESKDDGIAMDIHMTKRA